jgi:hypothetical protein
MSTARKLAGMPRTFNRQRVGITPRFAGPKKPRAKCK